MGNAGLIDLPTELLLSIITSTDDLYKLALLSRRLNFLFLPIFLAEMGISDPESHITINHKAWTPAFFKEPFDALAGLKIATYLAGKSVSRLDCCFQYPQLTSRNFQPYGTLSVAVGRLSTFIRRLGSIHTVKLHFLSVERHTIHYKTPQLDVPPYQTRVQNCITAFADLLNLLNEMGCRSLTVQYESDDLGSHMYSFHVKGSDSESSFFSRVKRTILRQPNPSIQRSLPETSWEYSAAPHSLNIQRVLPAAISNYTLTTLRIHSRVLLTPPFLSWTLDILEYSPQLTSLSIAHVIFSDLWHSTDIWRSVLAQIANVASAKITEFSVFNPLRGLHERECLAFISRLKGLVKLTIVNPYLPSWTHGHYPVPHLPYLRTLEAPEKIVQLFLRASPPSQKFSRSADAFYPLPQLQHLVLSPLSTFGDSLSHTPPNKDWNLLLHQLEYIHRSIPITFGINIQIGFQLNQAFMASHIEWRATNTNGESIDNFIFNRISEVSLHTHHVDTGVDHDNSDVLCQWLAALFPDLRLVAFTYYVPQATLPDRIVSLPLKTVQALMVALNERCPMVDRLVVPGGNFTKRGHIWAEI